MIEAEKKPTTPNLKAEQAPSNQPILNNAIIQTVKPPF